MKNIFLIFFTLLAFIQAHSQTTNNCTLTLNCGSSNPPMEIVTNGDFSNGNTSFTSGLPFDNTCNPGSYSVGSEPRDKCTVAAWINDLWDWNQNDSTGSFLIVDGQGGNTTIWQQTVAVENGETYIFSFNVLPCISSLNCPGQTFSIMIDTQQILVSNAGSYGQGANNWNNVCASFVYNGLTGNMPLSIVQVGSNGNNDYGLDGISLIGCCNVVPTQPDYSTCCGDGTIDIGYEWIPTGNIYHTNGFFTPVDGFGNHTGPIGGQFTSLPSCGITTTDFGNFRVYRFNPCLCSPGTYPLVYNYNNAQTGCTDFDTMNITVNPGPLVAFSPLTIDLCNYTGPTPINPLTNGVSCQISGPYVNPQNAFDAQAAGVGIHNITITCVDADGCSTTIQGTINVIQDGEWHQTTKNTVGGLDVANDVITDKNGNVYVVGTFVDETTLRGGSNTADITLVSNTPNPNSFFSNTFVAKYDACGDLIWANHSIDFGYNKGNGIAIDEVNEMVYITGNYRQSIRFGNAQHNINTTTCTGFNTLTHSGPGNSGYIAQFDMNDGCIHFIDEVIYNNRPLTDCRAITIDETDGNIYVGGRAGQSNNPNYLFMFVHKYSPTTGSGQSNALGGVIWSIFDMLNAVNNPSILNDMDYNETNDQLWMIGSFSKQLRIGNSATGFDAVVTSGAFPGTDAYYAMYRDLGLTPSLGSFRNGGAPTSGSMTGDGIAVDELTNSSFYTGTYRGTIANAFGFNPLNINTLINPSFQTYSYMIGVDATTPSAWARSGQAGAGQVLGTAVDFYDNKAYFSGDFEVSPTSTPNLIFDNIAGSFPFVGNSGGQHVYAACYDILGNGLWGNVTEGTNSFSDDHNSKAIAIDTRGHAFIVGDYNGTVGYNNGTPANGNLVASPNNIDYNAFVMRTEQVTGAFRKPNQPTQKTQEETVDQLTVFPNPTTGQFTVKFSKEIESGLLEILDVTGRVIHTEKVNRHQMQFDLKDHPQGIYLLKLTSNGNHQVKKLIYQ